MWVISVGQRFLMPPLPPAPQNPQSLAEEEVWGEVWLLDHLPQHGEGQLGAAALPPRCTPGAASAGLEA